jgi:hypothetical protein
MQSLQRTWLKYEDDPDCIQKRPAEALPNHQMTACNDLVAQLTGFDTDQMGRVARVGNKKATR